MNLPPKPSKHDPAWIKKEKWRKRREAQERQRISSDHELSGVRHRQPHRDKDVPLRWRYEKGVYHVEPVRITTGGGLNISQEDWDRIWEDKTSQSSTDSQPEDILQYHEHPNASKAQHNTLPTKKQTEK